MRKFSTICACSLICAFNYFSYSATSNNVTTEFQNDSSEFYTDCKFDNFVSDIFIVREINKDPKYPSITVENINDGFEYLVFNISPDTLFIDKSTKKSINIDSIKEGTNIYVYFSSAMTMSIPPQSCAYAVLTNVKGDTHDGESIRAILKDGKLYIYMGEYMRGQEE